MLCREYGFADGLGHAYGYRVTYLFKLVGRAAHEGVIFRERVGAGEFADGRHAQEYILAVLFAAVFDDGEL